MTVVSSFAPRKNVETLIKAFDRLPKKLKHDSSLFIVGRSEGWEKIQKKIENEVDSVTLKSIVISYNSVQQEYYELADVFVCTSLHEGFGLTILEAMSHGLPVICSNAASLPEVYGDAGIGVDPLDVSGFAKAIEIVLSDDKLRKEMREKSLERANPLVLLNRPMSYWMYFEKLFIRIKLNHRFLKRPCYIFDSDTF